MVYRLTEAWHELEDCHWDKARIGRVLERLRLAQ